MARLSNLPSSLAWGVAVLIAYLERRDPERATAREGGGSVSAGDSTVPTPPADGDTAPGGAEPPRPKETPPSAPPKTVDSPAAEEPSASKPAASIATDTEASLGPADTAPTDASAAIRSVGAPPPVDLSAEGASAPSAAAPDPLVDPQPGDTIVGPDAPIRSVTDDGPRVPAGAVLGDGSAVCPPDHPIKGNASSRIYHQPGQPSYDRTVAEFCFATERDAEGAGYRPPKR